jgi:hypothetical protein|tara:strand:- start:100 stop:459 length:360 start_codon:yes stop_codon:yes gene_type:complete
MEFMKKTDDEIFEIANPLWVNLVQASNKQDYGGFTKHFSETMLLGAHEIEIGKQWVNNKLLSTLTEEANPIGCLRRKDYITVIYKQNSTDSNEYPGDYLGRLVLGLEDDNVKVFGATIF